MSAGLREVPGVFSQGETLKGLETNICDAYRLMLESQETKRRNGRVKSILITA